MSSPDGIGPQMPQPDPRGWLLFDYLPDRLRNAEDSTLMCDYDRGRRGNVGFDRPATETEAILLASLGYDIAALDPQLVTTVTYLSPGVRRRRWPQLEGTES